MPIRLPSEPIDSALYLKGYYDAKLDYEVKHGQWVDRKFEDGEWYHTCSVCGMVLREDAFDNFCGNCGAKMGEDNITPHAECVVNLYTETKLRFVLDECIEDEELIEKILKALDLDEVEK